MTRLISILVSTVLSFGAIGLAQPAAAASDITATLVTVGDGKYLKRDSATAQIQFSGEGTKDFSNCSQLITGLGNRFNMALQVEGQSFDQRVSTTPVDKGATATSLTCQFRWSVDIVWGDISYTVAHDASLNVMIDGATTDSKATTFLPSDFEATASKILTPTRGETVGAAFVAEIEPSTGTHKYLGLGASLCEVSEISEDSCAASFLIDLSGREDATKVGEVVSIGEFATGAAIDNNRVKIVVVKAGSYRLTISRKFVNDSGTRYSLDSDVLITSTGAKTLDAKDPSTLEVLKDLRARVEISSCTFKRGVDSEITRGETFYCDAKVSTFPELGGTVPVDIYSSTNDGKLVAVMSGTATIGEEFSFEVKGPTAKTANYFGVFAVIKGAEVKKAEGVGYYVYTPLDAKALLAISKTVLKVSVTGPNSAQWGKVVKFSVKASPTVSGTCKYYRWQDGRILAATTKLTKGRSSANIKLLFNAAVGQSVRTSITVVCTAGKRTGTGGTLYLGYR